VGVVNVTSASALQKKESHDKLDKTTILRDDSSETEKERKTGGGGGGGDSARNQKHYTIRPGQKGKGSSCRKQTAIQKKALGLPGLSRLGKRSKYKVWSNIEDAIRIWWRLNNNGVGRETKMRYP